MDTDLLTLIPLTDLTPAEIDARWLPVEEHCAAAARRAAACRQRAEEALTDYDRERYEQDAARFAAEAAALMAELGPYRAEWDRRGGWERWHVCLSDGGHIHEDRRCSTLRATSRLAVVPELSGLSRVALVDRIGHHACTVCFPEAPTTAAWSLSLRVEEAARTLARDEKKRAARARLAKKVVSAETRLARAKARLAKAPEDCYSASDVRYERESLVRAQDDLARWDHANPGYAPVEAAEPVAQGPR
jgi:hypothetical protein